ncbi:MAG: alpha/beta fold hydrolase [Oligoflexia bacterium]|nr:alpha/beta fold hydrolase [Oligoflexia bacterium]
MDIIFFHGFMGSHHDWHEITCKLDSSVVDCCNIYLINLPGHNSSPIGDQRIETQEFIDSLQQWIREQSILAPVFVGYSMGSRIAISLALANQQTKGLFLESTSFGITDQKEREERKQADCKLFANINKTTFKDFLERWYEKPLFAGLKQHENYNNFLINKLQRNDPVELDKAIKLLGVTSFDSFHEKIKQLQMLFPITCLFGVDDEKYFTIGQQIKKLYSNVNVKFIDHCSHNVHFQKPEKYIIELNSFLQKVLER